MVTEFRTLFTNKCIDRTVTVMPLVREFNQVCQVFADNINQRYGYKLEPQTLTPEEVKIWAKQFRVPVAQAPLDISHLQPAMNGSQGAVSQPAGLFPPQQAQVQPHARCFLLQQKKPTDNYAKRCASVNHLPVEQVGAGRYKNGHTIDPVREELTCLHNVATKWEQQHPDNKKHNKCYQYLETNPKPRKQCEEQYKYPDNSDKSISIISAGLEKLANISERLVDNSQCLSKNLLQQAALDAINSFDGSNKADTTLWLEQVELLVERGTESAVEIAMAKLKGNPPRVISTLKKESGSITWESLKNTLLKKYSDVPYRSNAVAKYFAIRQGEDESCTQ